MELLDDRGSQTSTPRVSTFARGAGSADRGDRALSFTCPDGALHVLACSAGGQSARRAADFVVDATRMLVCQGMSLSLIVETLNVGVQHYYGNAGLVASAFLAVVHDEAITYVSAGHPDALLFTSPSDHRHLAASGPSLGVPAPPMEERTVRVRSGAALAVVTDAALTAPLGAGRGFEQSSFPHAVARACASAPHRLARAVAAILGERAAQLAGDCAFLTVRL